MTRLVILFVALLFIAMLGALTAIDIGRNGLNALDIVSVFVLVLFATGIIGALRHRPPPGN